MKADSIIETAEKLTIEIERVTTADILLDGRVVLEAEAETVSMLEAMTI